MRDWLKEHLAYIWIPLMLLIIGGILWMVLGECTTQRCIDSENFMKTWIEEHK